MRARAKDMNARLEHRHSLPAPVASTFPVATWICVALESRDAIRPDDELCVVVDAAIIAPTLPHGIEVIPTHRHHGDALLIYPIGCQDAANLLFLELGRLQLPLFFRLLTSKSLASSNAL